MNGLVDHSLAEPPHVCPLPDLYRYGKRASGAIAPAVYRDHAPGTRFHCDCGEVWVVVHKASRGLQPSGLVWRRESRYQRRKRLGLSWWRRTR